MRWLDGITGLAGHLAFLRLCFLICKRVVQTRGGTYQGAAVTPRCRAWAGQIFLHQVLAPKALPGKKPNASLL